MSNQMRRDLSRPEVNWTIRVPAPDKAALDALIPIHGGKTWIVTKAMTTFLDLIEASEGHRAWAHECVKGMHNESRKDLAAINVQIPSDLYVRFCRAFPEHGAASWFTRHIIQVIVQELSAEESLEERIENIVTQSMAPTTAQES